MSLDPDFWILLSCLLVLALRYDILFRRIPNWVVLFGLAGGIACNAFSFQWAPIDLSDLSDSMVAFEGKESLRSPLLGALAGLGVMLPLYLRHAMGAGDVKLMMAIGSFLGPMQIMGATLLTFIAGGVLALAVACGSDSLSRVVSNLRLMAMVSVTGRSTGASLRDVDTTGRLPYAIAISSGTLLQLYLAGGSGWLFE